MPITPHYPQPTSFRLTNLLGWLAAVGVLAAAVAWAVVKVEAVFAPLLLMPVAAGVVLGLGAASLLVWFPVPRSAVVAVALAMLGLCCGLGQHYVSYLQARAAITEELAVKRIPLTPEDAYQTAQLDTFAHYLDRQVQIAGRTVSMFGQEWTFAGSGVWALWLVESLLLAAAAASVGWWSTQHPFSDGQQTWFLVSERGTLEASDCQRLRARLCDLPEGTSGLYRLWKAGDDSPEHLVELTLLEPDAGRRHLWLSGDEARQVVKLIQ